MISVEGFIQQYGDNLYMGYIPKMKGLVVQGESIEEIKQELLTSLKVKIAFDYDLDISKIEEKEIKSLEDLQMLQGRNSQELKCDLTI